jgi:dTDP-4-dehydrorhamnose reductase
VFAAVDAVVSPTYVVDLVNATLDLLIDRERGIWHLTNGGGVSWAALAQRVAALAQLPIELVEGVPTHTGYAARRPRHAVLASERGRVMPSLADALSRYLTDSQVEVIRPVDSAPRLGAGRRRRRAA